MISPEVLRRYPFFAFLSADQLREIAMIASEIALADGEALYRQDEPAQAMYLLQAGTIELKYLVADEYEQELGKELFVGEIAPGEPFGFPAIVEPHKTLVTAVASGPSRLLRLDGPALRKLVHDDPNLGCGLVYQIAQVLQARLHSARIRVAAARA